MTGATADRGVGRLVGNVETSDPQRTPMSTGPVMDPATLEELRRLAIRTLDRLAREPRRQPMPPMPEGSNSA